MKPFFITLFFLATINVFGQSLPPEYIRLVQQADSLYKNKYYKTAAFTYSAAFNRLGGKAAPTDRYNAACSWALANYPDSAFYHLNRLVAKSNWSDYDQVLADQDLVSLHNDKRWQPLLDKIKTNKDKAEAGFNKQLVKLLDSLIIEDQKWRNYSTKYYNKQLGDDTITQKTISYNFYRTDSLNYFAAKKIFKEYGFPNTDLVGQKGSNSFCALIQHQDKHPSFQDTVLAAMKIEVDKGKASASDYAYLVDRVKVNTGQLQIYGSQMTVNKDTTSYTPKPVIEPEKLNERRKTVGLPPIEDYIKMMNERFYGSLKRKE